MADFELKTGLMGFAEETVSEKNTAKTMGSGTLDVYATPALCCLFERAACNLLEYGGIVSVGTKLDISHDAPTPLGAMVRAEARVTDIDGRRITFAVKAEDNKGTVAQGSHERFIVDADKFMTKANARK